MKFFIKSIKENKTKELIAIISDLEKRLSDVENDYEELENTKIDLEIENEALKQQIDSLEARLYNY